MDWVIDEDFSTGMDNWWVEGGKSVAVEGLTADARQAYVDIRNGKVARVTALGVTTLKVADAVVINQEKRGDYEK